MSMTMLTILQIAQALSAYTLVTLILPGIMLHKYLAEYKMSERLIGYFLAGNLSGVFASVFAYFSPNHIADWNDFSCFFYYLEKEKEPSYCIEGR